MSFTAPHLTFSSSPTRSAALAARHSAPRSVIAAAAAAVLAIGAYSALGHSGGASAPTAPARLLSNQVLATASLPGLVAGGPPVVMHDAVAWSATQRAALALQPVGELRSLGFTGGVVGRLRSPGARWTSVAERFRTPAGARTEARYLLIQLHHTPGATVTGFAVIGVPGAQGLTIAGPRTTQVATVFAAEDYVYAVTARFAGTGRSVTPAQVSAAGGRLYLALHGCAAPVPATHTGTPPVHGSTGSTRA